MQFCCAACSTTVSSLQFHFAEKPCAHKDEFNLGLRISDHRAPVHVGCVAQRSFNSKLRTQLMALKREFYVSSASARKAKASSTKKKTKPKAKAKAKAKGKAKPKRK